MTQDVAFLYIRNGKRAGPFYRVRSVRHFIAKSVTYLIRGAALRASMGDAVRRRGTRADRRTGRLRPRDRVDVGFLYKDRAAALPIFLYHIEISGFCCVGTEYAKNLAKLALVRRGLRK